MAATCWAMCVLYAVLARYVLAHEEKTDFSRSPNITEGNEGTTTLPNLFQKASCTVSAGPVQVSAEAVITKSPKDLCSSDKVNLAIQNMETKFYDELRQIKILLQTLQETQGRKIDRCNYTVANSNSKLITDKKMASSRKLLQAEESHLNRDQEINTFNNTVLGDRDLSFFTYFWKLEYITEHILNTTTSIINSPIFSIKGKTLLVQCVFQHLHRDLILLKLVYADRSRDSHNNIMMDMGGLLKNMEITGSPLFKCKICILDQSRKQKKDICSQEFINFDIGFSVPNSALIGSSYIKDNVLIIKTILYL
ncbi:uncharacterized protein LOC115628153 [Scaptodrosophila lebanonensis]|uniref:Uncharacterized protein LOC115628153 n=1 Tax=Drosophila lebanonensis TaxID=7225 RepID=A0A6J2TYM0_DROLE|nr:uncharacterized protein LOC115628153 [Scaptodrosophila lebanonensis]